MITPRNKTGPSVFGALGWTQSGLSYLTPKRRRIIGKAHHEMEPSMADSAVQAKAGTELAQAAIAPGRPETLAGVPQIQEREMHQLDLRRGLQLEETERLATQA